ncbi:MAG TPA: DUF4013 domain-containing protein [Methanobacterium sp.]
MDIGDVISDSLRYPTSDWSKLVIVGVLFLISFLIIPLFLVSGYMFRVIKASLAGVEELPVFEEWVEMLLDGIKLFLVYIIYSLPALIIAIISFISLWSSLTSLTYITQANGNTVTPDMFFALFGGTALIGLIIAGLYTLVIYPIMAVAIGNMAYYNGEFSAAFRFNEILSIISQIGWVDLIIWYIVLLMVGIAIGFLVSIIAIIPILGWIFLIFIVYPYFYLFYARAVAWLYSSAFAEEYVP